MQRFSPSKLEAKEKCPRFEWQRTEELDEAAEAGTRMHKAFETRDLTGLELDEAQLVEQALQYVDSLVAGHGLGARELSEIALSFAELTSGTSDKIIINEGETEADVIDGKFGRMPVTPAEHNFQIQCYVGGAFEKWPTLQRCRGHILIPQLTEITSHEFTRDDVPRIRARVQAVLDYARDPFNPPKPNDDLCSRCEFASRCPAINAMVKHAIVGLGLPMPSSFEPGSIATPLDKARAKILISIFETWGKQVNDAITASAKAGEQIPFFELRRRAGSARIVDTLGAFNVLREVLTQEQFLAACRCTFGKLNEVCSMVDPTLTRQRLQELLGNNIEVGPEVVFLQKARKVTEQQVLEGIG